MLATSYYTTALNQYPFHTKPNEYYTKSLIDEVTLTTVNTKYLNVDFLNGSPIVGSFVTTDAIQTITNKSLVDNSTKIISSIDPTSSIMFTASGTPGVTTMFTTQSSTNQNIIFPDIASGTVMMSNGDKILEDKITHKNGDYYDSSIPIPEITSVLGDTIINTIAINLMRIINIRCKLILEFGSFASSIISNILVNTGTNTISQTTEHVGSYELDGSITAQISGTNINIIYDSPISGIIIGGFIEIIYKE